MTLPERKQALRDAALYWQDVRFAPNPNDIAKAQHALRNATGAWVAEVKEGKE